jgi:hypothetical protein
MPACKVVSQPEPSAPRADNGSLSLRFKGAGHNTFTIELCNRLSEESNLIEDA